MQMPADLREGWYWLTYFGVGQTAADAVTEVARVYRASSGAARVLMVGCDQEQKLGNMADRITALEPVAPPSWEKPDA
jgi:hypothetical protein